MTTPFRDNDIAVVGLSCRFPGAPNARAYWELLRDGRAGTRVLDDEALIARGIDRRIFSRPDYVRVCADIPNIEWFDAPFFNCSPAEATMMDPQHRLFLESVWAALEDAAIDPSRFGGAIACFAGKTINSYIAGALRGEDDAANGLQTLLGNDKDYLATQVSYKLDLRGPSVTVQTACSTSLVAIHMACQSLLNGECDAAVAGGVSIRLPHGVGYVHQEGMVFSPDGQCRAFDAGANGMLSGNGVGVVVLRRANDAFAAGDPIRAIVRGTAINNDGARKVGFTAPSVDGQAAVIAEALAVADVDAGSISYIEAHGTGTPLGDPIEVAALTRALGEREGRCHLGSVKTNFGHLDAAAGVAGFIKTVLALEHRQLPPTLHFTQPNPEIDFASGGFAVQTTLADWGARGPRRAGVSSFGIGGTNAHAIVEEAPKRPAGSVTTRVQILPLSARSSDALAQRAADLALHVSESPDIALDDVAWTLQIGRRHFDHRRAIVASTIDQARAALTTNTVATTAQRRSLVFMFPGQGAQYAGMAQGLSAAHPIFRESFDRCLDLISKRLGTDLRQVMTADEDRLRHTQFAQPALFAVEYALARWLIKTLGRPSALIGHSVGELAAACIAGIFSLDDAVSLVVDRGRLMQSMPAGAMLAVSAPEEQVPPLLGERLSLAAVNGPSQCVVSGPADAIGEFESRMSASGVVCHPLRTSHAFHSASMDDAADAFAECVARVSRRAPEIPVLSNVTGTILTPTEAQDPRYWARQLRTTVRFGDGIRALLEQESRLLIEVGPGAALQGLARRSVAFGPSHAALSTLRQSHEAVEDEVRLAETIARAWELGADVQWQTLAGEDRRRIALPSYPFQRQRYWREPNVDAPLRADPDERLAPAQWFYSAGWKRVAPSMLSRSSDGQWLIVGGGTTLAAAIEEALRARGLSVRSTDAVDGAAVMALLAGIDATAPLRVLHLGSADVATLNFEPSLQRGFFSVMSLAAALHDRAAAREIELIAVSRGVFDVQGTEPLDPNRATILGPLSVIPQELPRIRTRLIDVAGDVDVDRLVDALVADGLPPKLALRGPYLWETQFDRVEMPQIGSAPSILRERGVYLITGGFGAIGSTLSRFLAERCRARLVLVGRSAISDRSAAQILELEQLGAEVIAVQADVADLDRMRKAIEAAKARFGGINGVFHAAGERVAATIGELTRDRVAEQFRAKVLGTRVLERALGDEPIDFCQIVSSLSSVLGGVGLAAYTAAHCFADACVQDHNRRHQVPWTTVNWDNWLSEDGDRFGDIEIASGHRHDEARAALDLIVQQRGLAQVLVSTTDLNSRLARWIDRDFLDESAGAGSASTPLYARPNVSADYAAPDSGLARQLVAMWQELLQIDRIGIHDNFFELGGDSVISIRFLAKAARAGIQLGTRDVFERQTIAALCEVAQVTGATAPVAEQGIVTGEAPLTPMQRWFIEQQVSQPSFFNHAMVYETPADLDVARLGEAVNAIVAHHDALRVAIVQSQDEWRQRIQPSRNVDLQVFGSDDDLAETIDALHRSVDLSAGDIVRAAHFGRGSEPGRLVIVVHHAAVDGFSWRIIAEDLERAYQQARSGARITLPEKTTSVLAWARALPQQPASTPVDRAMTALPRDLDGINTVASIQTIERAFDQATTALVMEKSRDRLDLVIQEALARALARFTGQATVTFDVEGHGRDTVAGVDLSRTVAWCTAISPVSFIVATDGTTTRSVELPGMRAEVVHCHLGQSQRSDGTIFKTIHQPQLLAQSPEDVRPWLIEADTVVHEGRFITLWRYSGNVHRRETIERVAEDFLSELRDVVQQRPRAADFPHADLEQDDLDELVAELSGGLDEDER